MWPLGECTFLIWGVEGLSDQAGAKEVTNRPPLPCCCCCRWLLLLVDRCADEPQSPGLAPQFHYWGWRLLWAACAGRQGSHADQLPADVQALLRGRSPGEPRVRCCASCCCFFCIVLVRVVSDGGNDSDDDVCHVRGCCGDGVSSLL